MRLRAADRVLMLSIPGEREVESLARQLTEGSLVALGTADEVDVSRARFSRLDNVLFLTARPDAIPWREAFFTKIVASPEQETLLRSCEAELHRVLAPGGEILILGEEC